MHIKNFVLIIELLSYLTVGITMAGGRRNLQRRGGRANRETQLPNSEEDRRQSPQDNHPPNSAPHSGNVIAT